MSAKRLVLLFCLILVAAVFLAFPLKANGDNTHNKTSGLTQTNDVKTFNTPYYFVYLPRYDTAILLDGLMRQIASIETYPQRVVIHTAEAFGKYELTFFDRGDFAKRTSVPFSMVLTPQGLFEVYYYYVLLPQKGVIYEKIGKLNIQNNFAVIDAKRKIDEESLKKLEKDFPELAKEYKNLQNYRIYLYYIDSFKGIVAITVKGYNRNNDDFLIKLRKSIISKPDFVHKRKTVAFAKGIHFSFVPANWLISVKQESKTKLSEDLPKNSIVLTFSTLREKDWRYSLLEGKNTVTIFAPEKNSFLDKTKKDPFYLVKNFPYPVKGEEKYKQIGNLYCKEITLPEVSYDNIFTYTPVVLDCYLYSPTFSEYVRIIANTVRKSEGEQRVLSVLHSFRFEKDRTSPSKSSRENTIDEMIGRITFVPFTFTLDKVKALNDSNSLTDFGYLGGALSTVRIYSKNCVNLKIPSLDTFVRLGLTGKTYDICSFSYGSGFVINEEGYIVSNAHVMGGVPLLVLNDVITIASNLLSQGALPPSDIDGGLVKDIVTALAGYSYSYGGYGYTGSLEITQTYTLLALQTLLKAVAFAPQEYLTRSNTAIYASTDGTYAKWELTSTGVQLTSGLPRVELIKSLDPTKILYPDYPEPEEPDLALGKLEANPGLIPVYIEKTPPFFGKRVYAVGFPGKLENLTGALFDPSYALPNITSGNITNIRESLNKRFRFILFDASIVPGNSGGPLIGNDGVLDGVVALTITGSTKSDISGGLYAGIDKEAVLKLLEEKGITYNDSSATTELIKTIDYLEKGYYRWAVKQLEALKEINPSYYGPILDPLIESVSKKVGTEEDKTPLFVIFGYPISIVHLVIVALLVIFVFGGILVLRSRRSEQDSDEVKRLKYNVEQLKKALRILYNAYRKNSRGTLTHRAPSSTTPTVDNGGANSVQS